MIKYILNLAKVLKLISENVLVIIDWIKYGGWSFYSVGNLWIFNLEQLATEITGQIDSRKKKREIFTNLKLVKK